MIILIFIIVGVLNDHVDGHIIARQITEWFDRVFAVFRNMQLPGHANLLSADCTTVATSLASAMVRIPRSAAKANAATRRT